VYKSQYRTGILNESRAKGKGFDLIRGGERRRNNFLHQALVKFLQSFSWIQQFIKIMRRPLTNEYKGSSTF